jgi:DNA-binding NarL/FixJ family response regulator
MASDPTLQSGTLERPEPRLKVFILSDTRFLAEGLAQALERDDRVASCWSCTDFHEGLAKIANMRPDIVLLDAALQWGPEAVGCVLQVERRTKVVVFAVAETSDNVLAWAKAGVAGYIPRTAALSDVASLLVSIMCDEQMCSARVAASLLRHLSQAANGGGERTDASAALPLTPREMQIVELLAAGLSNKDIARRLNIGVATTKSHVHNLLGKLRVQRRGQVALRVRDHAIGVQVGRAIGYGPVSA